MHVGKQHVDETAKQHLDEHVVYKYIRHYSARGSIEPIPILPFSYILIHSLLLGCLPT